MLINNSIIKMSSYTNPIILNLNLDILKGTFTYKFDNDKIEIHIESLKKFIGIKRK